MLTALGGKKQAVLLQHRQDAVADRGRSLHTGPLADALAHDLAGRTAHHKEIARFKARFGQQFLCGPPRLFPYLI